MKKTYLIVTNNDKEKEIASGVSSIEATKIIGIGIDEFVKNLAEDNWGSHKYKAYIETPISSVKNQGEFNKPRSESTKLLHDFLYSDQKQAVLKMENRKKLYNAQRCCTMFLYRHNINGIYAHCSGLYLILERV